MRKPKSLKLTTPKGTAIYPWLNEPNRKFDPAGVYAVNLRMTADEAETFINKITEVRDEHHQSQTKELKKKLKKADLPVIEVVDDQGNETGEIELKCKLKASYEYDGKTITQRPVMIDAKQQKVSDDVRVGSGTTMKVGVEVRPWYVPSQGVGVSLRLKVVQIIDLVEFGGGAGGFDFDDEEGFETISANLSDANEDDGLEGMM
tara:strand:- start:2146 stop:2757 length:612 start_codon:yes stop_codon:yes gene_type:complete